MIRKYTILLLLLTSKKNYQSNEENKKLLLHEILKKNKTQPNNYKKNLALKIKESFQQNPFTDEKKKR